MSIRGEAPCSCGSMDGCDGPGDKMIGVVEGDVVGLMEERDL